MHEPNASLSLNVLSFTRFLHYSVAAEFGQTPGSDRRNSTQRCKNQPTENPNNQKNPNPPADAEVSDYQNNKLRRFPSLLKI